MSEKRELVELNIDVDREAFVKSKATELLKELDPEAQPLWGMMSPQHMVEHLIYITENILKDREVVLLTPEEKLPKYKAYLMGSFGFMRNFKFPMLPMDELVPLGHTSYEEAVEAFKATTCRLFELLDDPNFETSLHPMYGHLDREETIMFQFKHLSHHLMQFGMVSE